MDFQCRLCAFAEGETWAVRDAKSLDRLVMGLCARCGLVQQLNMPTDEALKIYYAHHYRQDYKKTYEPKLKYVQRAGHAALDRLRFIKTHLKADRTLRLLDIGAGGGEFVYLSRKHGFEASGVEPNEGYAQYAQKTYGVDIRTQMFDELDAACSDVVTLFHVFEHMANPQAVMKKLADVLTDDGVLVIEVPNLLQGDASPHNIFFKAHLFYYCRYTLAAAASRYFDVLQIEDAGNLKAIFRKRRQVAAQLQLPDQQALAHIRRRLSQKGWVEYVLLGGGWRKPFKRLARMWSERQLKGLAARQVLDQLT
ncbi:MAG TPA: class I SAM-dependent methyltransferase [Burkholderiaceae bacterium]|nr:class I SAM-dependent methyltransferase [Burkholderiaceae bacterium]